MTSFVVRSVANQPKLSLKISDAENTPFCSFSSYILKYFFNIHWSVHRKNIPIYIQQDATLRSLFYLETALHISGCTSTHRQESKQRYLQHLVFVIPLLLFTAIVEELELV
jgi:hypothetical protein